MKLLLSLALAVYPTYTATLLPSGYYTTANPEIDCLILTAASIIFTLGLAEELYKLRA